MAKSVTKKKTNRRLKRSIRRTLGALCMTTSIIVAAIPFPDAAADNGSAGTQQDTGYPYEYKVSDPDDYLKITDTMNQGADVIDTAVNYYKYEYDEDGNLTDTKTKYFDQNHTAYTIYQNSSKVWQMDWQFEYYATGDNLDGLITQYNGQYAREEVDLQYQVYADYIYITESDYYKFMSQEIPDGESQIPEYVTVNAMKNINADFSNLTKDDVKIADKKIKTLYHPYIIKGNPASYEVTDSNVVFFQEYFPEEYLKYVQDYQAYLDYLDDIKGATEEELKDIPTVREPSPIMKTFADVYTTDTDRTQFFCNQVFGGATPMELIGVRLRAATNPENDTVYVPRLLAEPNSRPVSINTLLYWVDDNLFLADKTNSIAGIAKNAFKGVTNVTTLTMASEIDFIGDSAFEGSFVKSVSFVKGAKIGNSAFKDCQDLVNVDMTAGVKEIGAEAFSGTAVEQIIIPNTVETIGAGAFYNCKSLQDIIFRNTAKTEIQKYAFFDCPAITTVDFGNSAINMIGDCAFALAMVPTGGLADFKFADSLSNGSNIGEYLFGGRTNLKNVTMPINLGTASPSTLNNTLFYNCTGLSCVTFPETCYNISFDKDIFKDVKNPEFYVRGPKTDGAGGTAAPRSSTWVCTFGDTTEGQEAQSVPYVFTENGVDYFEICDEKGYLSVVTNVDGKGTLVSSQFMPEADKSIEIGTVTVSGNGYDVKEPYEIPATVGTTPIVAIADGCFAGKDGILNNIVALKIADGSGITSIGDNVFSEASRLRWVYIGEGVQTIGNSTFAKSANLEYVEIGSSITSIGESAFEGCSKLEYIKFVEPETVTNVTIGNNAFSTGGAKLTIEGKIDQAYGPFAWAMNPSCFMNNELGVRVLYKSPEPQNMLVILDNLNNMPTLVDYPHYEDLDSDLRARYEAGEQFDVKEAQLIDACINVKIPSGVKSIDAQAYFNSSSVPKDGITVNMGLNNKYSIQAYFCDENKELKDIYKLYADEKEGGLFSGNFGGVGGEYSDGASDSDGNEYEVMDIGNDRIKTVEMASVEYLPDGCFYSCENLESVLWSEDMTDVGSLPFEYCTKLDSVGGSSHFTCANGILYRNEADGKVLVECFASRGTEDGPGASTISIKNDPELLNVTSIEPGAFRNCKELISADLVNGGTAKFTSIPEECFKGCELLAFAYLPESVTFIGREAFADTGESTDVWVYSRTAILGDNVYGVGEEKVSKPKLTAYEDAPIRQQAKDQGIDIKEVIPEDGTLSVTFYVRQDNNLVEVGKVTGIQPGDSIRKSAPDEVDLADYIPEGYELSGWEGTEDLNNITQNCFFIAKITLRDSDGDGIPDIDEGKDDNTGDNNGDDGKDDGNKKPGSDDGNGNNNTGNNNGNGNNNSGNNNGNGNGSTSGNGTGTGTGSNTSKYTLTVVYGDGSGVYAAGTKVIISAIQPPAGKEFYKWVSNNTGVTITSATSAATTVKTTNSDATITATYRDKSTVSGSSINRKPIGSSNSSTTVQISKPGISNIDKAYASVSGSTDNFIVKITESTAAANAVATALANVYPDMSPIKYFAMDISLYDKNGNQITNTNGLSVNITMPIPDALVQYGGNNKVGAVVNGNTLEKLNCKFTTVSGIPCVTFTATHFSPYTIYVDTSNLSVNTLDTTPKTGDGIHPKWFFSIGLACISLLLFMKRDKTTPKTVVS